jgi:hypothetical protein
MQFVLVESEQSFTWFNYSLFWESKESISQYNCSLFWLKVNSQLTGLIALSFV